MDNGYVTKRKKGKPNRKLTFDSDEEDINLSDIKITKRIPYPFNGVNGIYEGEYIQNSEGFYFPNGKGNWKAVESLSNNLNPIIECSGIWKNGTLNGDDTVIIYKDNSSYKGNVVNNIPDGKGEYTDKFGVFNGEFKNGKKEGEGIIYLRNDNGVVIDLYTGGRHKPSYYFKGFYENDIPKYGFTEYVTPDINISYEGEVGLSDSFPYYIKNGKGEYKVTTTNYETIANIFKLEAQFIPDFIHDSNIHLEKLTINSNFVNDNMNDENIKIRHDTIKLEDEDLIYRIQYEGEIITNDFKTNELTCKKCKINAIDKTVKHLYIGGIFSGSLEGYGDYNSEHISDSNLNVSYTGDWFRGSFFGKGIYKTSTNTYTGFYLNGKLYGVTRVYDRVNKTSDNITYFNDEVIEYTEQEKQTVGSENPVEYDDGYVVFDKYTIDEDDNEVLTVYDDNIVDGAYFYKNGDIYLGNILNGTKNGYGELFLKSGATIVGNWNNDKYRHEDSDLTNEFLYEDYYNILQPRIVTEQEYDDYIGKSCFDVIMGDMNISDYLEEYEDYTPIVIIGLNDNIECYTADGIKKIIGWDTGMSTLYPCLGNRNLDSSIPVDLKFPFYKITNYNLLVPQKDVINMIERSETGSYLFEIISTEVKLDRTGSSSVLLDPSRHPGSYVSADHCQAGSNKAVYRIREISK